MTAMAAAFERRSRPRPSSGGPSSSRSGPISSVPSRTPARRPSVAGVTSSTAPPHRRRGRRAPRRSGQPEHGRRSDSPSTAAANTRRGRADLHIHTVAEDGTAGVAEILEHVERRTDLDVIAITDHERIDAAVAARSMARDRGLRADVVVGEEVTTRGGHLLALYIERPIPAYRSLRDTIIAVHDAGGLAVPAHPLVPYPLCAQGFVLRGLLEDSDPRVHPDGLETLNPTTLGRPRTAASSGSPTGTASPTSATATPTPSRRSATGWTTFPGSDAAAPPTRDRNAANRARRVLPRHGRPVRRLRTPAAETGGGHPRRAARQTPPRWHGTRSRLSRGPPAAASLRAGSGRPERRRPHR